MIKHKTKEQLEDLCLELLSKTYIELGQHNVEAETKVIMAQSLADDLRKTYKNFYFSDAENAFNIGVRSQYNGDFIHLNVPTYMRWLRKHKDLIWDARAKVDRGDDPKSVPHYRPEPKLLK
jgi:hypothetical protein